jgi:hypothetical protein
VFLPTEAAGDYRLAGEWTSTRPINVAALLNFRAPPLRGERDLGDQVALGIRVLVHVLPLSRGELALEPLVGTAVLCRSAQPVTEAQVALDLRIGFEPRHVRATCASLPAVRNIRCPGSRTRRSYPAEAICGFPGGLSQSIGRIKCSADTHLELKTWHPPATRAVIGQLAVVIFGLVFAGWGQLLVRERTAVVDAWIRIDSMFPPVLRSTPTFAGYTLLLLGSVLALVPLFG